MSMSGIDAGSPTLDPRTKPDQSSAEVFREDIGAASYESAPEGQLLPPPTFRPFFTLIEDAASGEHYHPAVHYFFSDDDSDGLTSSVLESLQPSQQDPNHRLLLVDIGADGRTVTSAHSLNSTWQITNTGILPAPSWTESGPEAASEGLMLRVEGQEALKQSDKEKRRSASDDVLHRLESDIEAYMDRLGHLQSVLAKGDAV